MSSGKSSILTCLEISSRNSCSSVRATCAEVMDSSRHVRINREVLTTLADKIAANLTDYNKLCEWNTDWHYRNTENPILT